MLKNPKKNTKIAELCGKTVSLRKKLLAHPLKRLAGQTVIYGLSSMIPRFLNYLLVPLHTAVLPPAEYGINTELYAYVTFLVIILTYGLETGFFRFSQTTDKDRVYGTTFLSIVVTSTIFTLGVTLFAQPIANMMHYNGHREYIIWFGWILGLDTLSAIPFARFRIDNRPLRFAFYKLFNVGVNVLFNLFFLWFCPRHADCQWVQTVWNPDVGVGYIFLANLFASAATIVLLLPEIFKHKISFDFALWKRILAYSLPLMAAGLAGTVNETIDRVLLKHRLPDVASAMEQLGIYGANIKIAVLMTLFIQMFRYAAEPFFFNNAKEKDSRQTIADVLKFFVIFCLVIFLGVTCYIDPIKHFINPRYWQGLDVVPIMLLANMCLGIYFNLSIWFKLNNQTWFGIRIAAIGAAISLAGNWFLIPFWGFRASAWLHLICYAVMMIITWKLGKTRYPIPYDLKRIFLYAVLAIILFIPAYFISFENILAQYLKNTILLFTFVFFIEKNEGLIKKLIKR